MWLRWVSLGLLAMLPACPPPEPPPAPIPPVSTGKVRVRVFTEPSAVKQIVALGKFTFVGTDDALERWDDKGGLVTLSADHGLAGDRIVALAPDLDRKWLWVLTDGGLGYYDLASEAFTGLAAPPATLGIDLAALAQAGGATIASAAEGGVWLGTPKGLFFVSEKGGWLATPIKDPVRAVLRDRAGNLWIAAKGALIARRPSGDMGKIGGANGCDVAEPRLLVEVPGERVMAIGTDEAGHERIAIGKRGTWRSYRALPDVVPQAATARGGGAIVIGGGRMYRIAPDAGGVRPLSRDGTRLVPIAGGTPSDWSIDPLDVVVPTAATALGVSGDQVLVGTRDLGTARFRDGDPHPRDWLRRRQMFEDATTLTVACARAADCWIATGARQAWHWTGERFVIGGPAEVVLAVARDPSGPLYALHRGVLDKEIHVSRIEGGTWTPLPKIALTTPGDAPEVSFVRFASAGTLWVGLRYRDGSERRQYGVAIVDPVTAKVAYHRTDHSPDSKMLPIPIGVVDADVRGDVAWFATNEGVARLSGSQVKLWTEADGLRSELARAITITPEGGVVIATGEGAGIWDGKAWDFPAALQFEINDVVATHNGQIWMATERGIAAWDGKKVRRVDTRRGLAEDEVLEIAVDQFDRVWARGPGSLTLISQ